MKSNQIPCIVIKERRDAAGKIEQKEVILREGDIFTYVEAGSLNVGFCAVLTDPIGDHALTDIK